MLIVAPAGGMAVPWKETAFVVVLYVQPLVGSFGIVTLLTVTTIVDGFAGALNVNTLAKLMIDWEMPDKILLKFPHRLPVWPLVSDEICGYLCAMMRELMGAF